MKLLSALGICSTAFATFYVVGWNPSLVHPYVLEALEWLINGVVLLSLGAAGMFTYINFKWATRKHRVPKNKPYPIWYVAILVPYYSMMIATSFYNNWWFTLATLVWCACATIPFMIRYNMYAKENYV